MKITKYIKGLFFFALLAIIVTQTAVYGLPLEQEAITFDTVTLEDYSDIITPLDLGFNDFGGNSGFLEEQFIHKEVRCLDITTSCYLHLAWDFGANNTAFTGIFHSLSGLTDNQVTFDGGPPINAKYPEHFLNLDDVDGILQDANGDRRFLEICTEITYAVGDAFQLKLELTDTTGKQRFTRVLITPHTTPQTYCWDFRNSFIESQQGFLLTQAKLLAFVIERNINGAYNSAVSMFDIHHIWFTLDQVEVLPDNDDELLELTQKRLYQYFLDSSSRKPDSLDFPQDRSTFADLLTVGGIGFALPAHITAVEHGWITRTEASERVLNVLRVLDDPSAFCADSVGCIGYKGWFYHFLGTDGRRKLNFDYPESPIDESLNTVELSSIDTSLALMGILTAQSYFDSTDAVEIEIRSRAQSIYDRVDWPFLLEKTTQQFYLGWKPNEERDSFPAFEIADADGKGAYSGAPWHPQTLDYYTDEALMAILLAAGSTSHPTPTAELYHAVRFNADKNGLVRTFPGALFTYQFMGAFMDTNEWEILCPSVNWQQNSRLALQQVFNYAQEGKFTTYGANSWGLSAAEGPFDKYHAYGAPVVAVTDTPEEDGTITYYGMLSAASFSTEWRQRAIDAIRAGAERGHWNARFGLPDAFNAEISEITLDPAPTNAFRYSGAWTNRALFAIDQGPALLHLENARTGIIQKLLRKNPNIQRAVERLQGSVVLQAESGTGDGAIMQRGNAWNHLTVQLNNGESRMLSLSQTSTENQAPFAVRYSNDNSGSSETVSLAIDGVEFGSFLAEDTGDGGFGWNIFKMSPVITLEQLMPGEHQLSLSVSGGDGYGIEIDAVTYCTLLVPTTPILHPISNHGSWTDYTVTWRPTAHTDEYELQERVAGGTWATIYTGKDTFALVNKHLLATNGRWEYRVRSSNTVGTSDWSNIQPVEIILKTADLLGFGQGNGFDSLWLATANSNVPFFDRHHEFQAAGTFDAMLVGDYNGDGLSDVLAYGQGNSFDSLWLATGNTHEPFFERHHEFVANGTFDELIVGDFNGDSRSDILGFGQGSNFDSLWLATGNANEPFFERHHEFQAAGSFDKMLVGDYNGDGLADILAYGQGTKFDSLWLATGNASEPFFEKHDEFVANGTFDKLIVGDFNGDGRSDILGFGQGNAFDSLWLATGNTQEPFFERHHEFVANGTYDLLIPGEFNRDGRTDVLAFGQGNHADSLWLATGNSYEPFFDLHHEFQASGTFDEMIAADFNSDGRTDVLAFGQGNAFDSLWLASGNTQEPFFERHHEFVANGSFDSILVGYFDAH
ncbi:MAG: VCBS repeat-containing protein [Anaerolineales bacterium]|nr:VCBS repeat-containing protein [Anaerolineales bacterium]